MTVESDATSGPSAGGRQPLVPRWLERAAAWSWRGMVVGLAVVAALVLANKLRLVLVPIFIALLLATVITPAVTWLSNRGLPRWMATWVSMLVFLGSVVAVLTLVFTQLLSDLDQVGDALSEARADIENWLVTGPLGLEQQQVTDTVDAASSAFRSDGAASGIVVDGAIFAGELVAGGLLALVLTFFIIKDGPALQAWALRTAPSGQRDTVQRVGASAWSTLRHYLLGAAILGLVESIAIGITLLLVGSDVVIPVAVLTFIGAFFPFLGAIVAGTVAVLVTLASAGVGPAIIVALVALFVQQFDNDLLAPVIYGKALNIHPLVVILSVTVGATIGGLLGAFIAVPATALVLNGVMAARETA